MGEDFPHYAWANGETIKSNAVTQTAYGNWDCVEVTATISPMN